MAMAARGVALGAVFVLVGATCSLTHDVDGISESGSGGQAATATTGAEVSTTGAATVGPGGVTTASNSTTGSPTGGGDGGMSAGGGAPPASGGAGPTTDTVTTTTTEATTDTTTVASGCVEPSPCGIEGQACCMCTTPVCTDGSFCDGTTCGGCGALGQPPCNDGCDGAWMRSINGVCKHCCVKCQGEGTGNVENGHAVNPDQGGGSCPAAADKNCDNLKGCGTNDPGDCCGPDTSCVNDWGWSTCGI